MAKWLARLEMDEQSKVSSETSKISSKIHILDVLMNFFTSSGERYFAVSEFWDTLFDCLSDIFSDTEKEHAMDIPEIGGMAILLRDAFFCEPCIVKMTYDDRGRFGKWQDEPAEITVNGQAVGKDCFIHSLIMNPEGMDGAIVDDQYVLTFQGLTFIRKPQ